MTYSKLSLMISCLATLSAQASGSTPNIYNIDQLHSLTLNELLSLEVISASRTAQSQREAPANITVITPTMIAQRGYQNLIEVLMDVPGFDFSNFDDSAGEYTTHSINRGIGGSPGNVQLLILVDGVIQNHIAFNWSGPWGQQQIFSDLKRIEIIQGPGSATYGANAYSGIIHFITASSDNEISDRITASTGKNNTLAASFVVDHQFSELYLQASANYYKTDGDSGLGRYDPAGYFAAVPWPDTQSIMYDENNQALMNSPHPYASQLQQPGFNNQSTDWAVRGKASWQPKTSATHGLSKLTLGAYKWDQQQGLGSYVTGFEYQTRAESYKKHHSAQQVYLAADYQFSKNTKLISKLWYRDNKQLPDTGFQYAYRFVELIKSYHSLNKQTGFEQELNYQADKNKHLLIGYRLQSSDKMAQIVSLGQFQDVHSASTFSSWDLASTGSGLFQTKKNETFKVDEKAAYIQFQNQLNTKLNYTLGVRYDHSDDFGSTINPRLAAVFNADTYLTQTSWRIKFLYGEAFREPSIFELNDEFRGNHYLKPETVKTYEIVNQWASLDTSFDAKLKASIFYSKQNDIITLKSGAFEGGSKYINGNKANVYGFALDAQWQPIDQMSLYLNYQFTDGSNNIEQNTLEHIAKNKINWGINYLTLKNKLNINLRFNHILNRQTPDSNSYFTGDAASLTLANMHIAWRAMSVNGIEITPSLMIKNLFDKDYLAVGRQDGSSQVSDYDPKTNINPIGFTPPYHPQAGRMIEARVSIKF